MQISSKKDLRIFYKNLRNEMSLYDRKKLDMKICEKVINLSQYKNCECVLVYVSSSIEVDTHALIEHSFQANKIVLAPRCIAGTNLMDFCEINSFDDLKSGAFGIMEPKEKCKKTEFFGTNSCCIVPALSYDKRGYRLGFGKGFYDRFLDRYKGYKIGLCYDNCVTDQLPSDDYDKTADCVITDRDIIYFSKTD